jgi:hypothetical protein
MPTSSLPGALPVSTRNILADGETSVRLLFEQRF